MIITPSLFDAPTEPVISTGASWVNQTLLSSAAISMCVIAIACWGFMLMSGRLVMRDAARVTLGCFVLLGAPTIALSIQTAARDAAPFQHIAMPVTPNAPPSQPIPPATYDPYAGASLRPE